MLKDFAGNLEEAKSFLIIEDQGINQETGLPRTTYSFKEEIRSLGLDLEYYVGQFILCSKITGYLNIYDRYSKFFSPYFNLIIYSLYFLGWLYVLCINFL